MSGTSISLHAYTHIAGKGASIWVLRYGYGNGYGNGYRNGIDGYGYGVAII